MVHSTHDYGFWSNLFTQFVIAGNISKSEIRSIAGDLGLPQPMSDLEIEKFMERADRNGDGSIDQDEFLEYALLF